MLPGHATFARLALGILLCVGCGAEKSATTQSTGAHAQYAHRRAEMVKTQLAGRDITDQRVLDAMGKVPRERFVMQGHEGDAYDDRALPIAEGQTISQPYIVALMTQLAEVKPGDRILDIGTGSGYQAAVLAQMGAEVYSIEIVPALAEEATKRLADLKYDKAEVRAGDGYRGWPEHAPFAAIILAAAAPEIPKPLIEQLAPRGKLVMPVGEDGAVQDLVVITKQTDGATHRKSVAPVRFVPMTGEVRDKKRDSR